MKSLVLLPLLILTSCDGPSRMRESASIQGSSLGAPTTPTTSTTGTGTGTTTGTTTGSSTPAGFENCGADKIFSHAVLGQVKVCQNSGNELYFRVEYSKAVTTQADATCIVPLYKDSNNNSTWLGAAQCTIHSAGQVSYGYVSKSRSGYTQYPVNGVMVMKYSATNAFFQCMNGYATSYQACAPNCAPYGNNPTTYQQCLSACGTQATNYMSSMCSTFRSGYAYIDIRTK
jgi:hypothetical protein